MPSASDIGKVENQLKQQVRSIRKVYEPSQVLFISDLATFRRSLKDMLILNKH